MASSPSSISIPLASPKDYPVALVKEWYKIRDMFCGENFVERDIPKAIELASTCLYPDAQWLTAACAGKNVKTKKDALEIFSALDPNDARALCFVWNCGQKNVDHETVIRAAELGFAYAQSHASRIFIDGRNRTMATLSALQGERDGFGMLGFLFGRDENMQKAKENYLLACNLGCVWSMYHIGQCFHASDPQRWKWFGCAAKNGCPWEFVSYFVEQVKLHNHAVTFAIGQALIGYLNVDRSIHCEKDVFETRLADAKKAVAFYQSQLKASRRAVDTWTMVAKRLNVCRDIRKLIGQQVWSAREEALYE